MVRPIYFYTKMKEQDWKQDSLTYLLVNSWILAFFAAIMIFIVQYIPIGSTLVEGIGGIKFLTILPVLLVLIFVFFSITFLILGGLFSLGFFIMLFLAAWLLHYVYIFLGGKGSLNKMVQACFYSSAVLLPANIIIFLLVLVKYGPLNFTLFKAGFAFIYLLMAVYWYGLWAIAGRKTYKVAKAKAFLGAAVPAIALLIFAFIFGKIILPRFEPWIT